MGEGGRGSTLAVEVSPPLQRGRRVDARQPITLDVCTTGSRHSAWIGMRCARCRLCNIRVQIDSPLHTRKNPVSSSSTALICGERAILDFFSPSELVYIAM